MSFPRSIMLLAFLLPGAAYLRASSLAFGAAAGYNVFTFGNFTEYNTSVQGKAAVGGSFNPANGGGITIASGSSDGAGVYDLVVGGSFNMSGYSVGGGDIFVGGSMS